jgi:hypothetical protein
MADFLTAVLSRCLGSKAEERVAYKVIKATVRTREAGFITRLGGDTFL